MKSEIAELCYNYLERKPFVRTAKCIKLEAQVDKIYESLDAEHKKIFNELFELQSGIIAEIETAHLKAGFKLGLKLAMESVLI
ncbi:MAG: hypothetical protein K2O89_04520 [Clostridia bacterium]|nr:hypothetical protein [Clostridia bacterium]